MAIPSIKYQGRYCRLCCKEKNSTLENDPAIQRYFTSLRSRPKSYAFISDNTSHQTLSAARRFLIFLNIPIPNHAISTLIKEKQLNPQDFTMEDNLELFSNEKPIKMHRVLGARILGIFKSNRARLQATSDTNFESNTQPIPERILHLIWSRLDREKQLLMQYQACAGQRVRALARVPFHQIDLTHPDHALIHIEPIRNKSRLDHYCIVPKSLMLEIIQFSSSLGRDQPFPNHKILWRQITSLAKREYGVKLTSQYLRKRFHSVAEETNMPVNYWLFLMGQKKSFGHLPSYSLTFKDKLIEYYDLHLAPRLSLDHLQAPQPSPSYTTSLLEQITCLRKELAQYQILF